jgi:CheY-like chemotaxis protein/anti-sigma regulatory factor (Ser/Thr protein kinase)
VLVSAPFLMQHLLDDGCATFACLAARKGLNLVAEPLDDALGTQTFVGDFRRLQQCLNNGISNAIKFTDRGGSIRLAVTATPLQPAAGFACVHVRVTDTGIGLDEREQEVLRAGDLFSQVGRGQLQGNGGSGLGLSITRQLLELHDGSSLRVSSAGIGQGTCFELVVKLRTAAPLSQHDGALEEEGAQAPASRNARRPNPNKVQRGTKGRASSPTQQHGDARIRCEPAAARGDAKSGADAPKRALRCLLVDDDGFLRLTLPIRIFTSNAVAHDVAVDGLDAVEQIQAEPLKYALVVMDNQMPRMNGTTATRKLRELGYAGIIIGMTGDPSGCSEREEFEESGLTACVDKDTAGVERVMEMVARLKAEGTVMPPGARPPLSRSGRFSPTSVRRHHSTESSSRGSRGGRENN